METSGLGQGLAAVMISRVPGKRAAHELAIMGDIQAWQEELVGRHRIGSENNAMSCSWSRCS